LGLIIINNREIIKMKTKLSPFYAAFYSIDKRKRRNQHRTMAKSLISSGGFFNGLSAKGSTFGSVAWWHLQQARYLGR
jgi:hypothetical protein